MSFPAARQLLPAASILLLLTGCAGSSSVRDIVSRDLPAAPAYLRPVAVPDPKAGDDAIAIAARERAGRLKANRIITNARTQWEKLRVDYKATR